MGFSLTYRQQAIEHYTSVDTHPSLNASAVSLHSGDTGETGANELQFFAGYSRVSRPGYVVSGRRGEDTSDGDFGVNSGSTARPLSQFGVWDSSSGGNFLFGASLDDAPVVWLPGESINWAAGGLGLECHGSRVGSLVVDMAHEIVRWYLGFSVSRPASMYMSFHYGDPGSNGANEYSIGGYARTGAITWQTIGGTSTVENSNTLTSGSATPDWGGTGTVSHFGLWDSQSLGSYIIGGNVIPDIDTPRQNLALTVAAGGVSISLS